MFQSEFTLNTYDNIKALLSQSSKRILKEIKFPIVMHKNQHRMHP
jgi:hypothetical protein